MGKANIENNHGIKSLLVYVGALYFIVYILFAAILNKYMLEHGAEYDYSFLETVGCLVVNAVFTMTIPFWLKNRNLLFVRRQNLLRIIFIVVTGLIASIAINACIIVPSELLHIENALDVTIENPVKIGESFGLYLMSFAVAPAIAEELIFRGTLFSVARVKLNFWYSALISSALFGLAHGIGLLSVITFFMGMLWCYIYEKTKNIFVTMGIHLLYNSIVVIGGVIAEKNGSIDVGEIKGSMQLVLIVCLAAIIIVASVLIIRKLTGNDNALGEK